MPWNEPDVMKWIATRSAYMGPDHDFNASVNGTNVTIFTVPANHVYLIRHWECYGYVYASNANIAQLLIRTVAVINRRLFVFDGRGADHMFGVAQDYSYGLPIVAGDNLYAVSNHADIQLHVGGLYTDINLTLFPFLTQ